MPSTRSAPVLFAGRDAFDCEGREGERRDDPYHSSSASRALKIALPVLALSCAYSLGRASSVRDGRAFSAERLDRVTLVAANATDAVLARDAAHPPILYGHIHMAKTGGTSLNGILANKFERVCGNKGYSYDAYADNERVKKKKAAGENVRPEGRSKVGKTFIDETGYEDCDFVSREKQWSYWTQTFGGRRFHGVEMELHLPCRSPIDHLMSGCNYRHREIECDAETDEDFFRSISKCVMIPTRFSKDLLNHFTVKCFDFRKQFTTYIDYMAERLQRRRFESTPFVKRETNRPRNKTSECIWTNEKALQRRKRISWRTTTITVSAMSVWGQRMRSRGTHSTIEEYLHA